MLLGIDHLVIAVADPDAAAQAMASDLGIAATGGGRHERGGTYNRLAFLGDTYLELIGVFNRATVESASSFAVGGAALRLLDEGREGLATWAIASDDVAADVARLRAEGSQIGAASAGSRTRPDGEVVRWITAFPALGPEEPPFLIEHEPRGAEWGPAARAGRAAFRHPVGGVLRLAQLTLPARAPASVAAAYRETLGVAFGSDGEAVVHGQVLRLVAAAGTPEPIVDIVGEPGSGRLDVVRFGIRWRRVPAPPRDRTQPDRLRAGPWGPNGHVVPPARSTGARAGALDGGSTPRLQASRETRAGSPTRP